MCGLGSVATASDNTDHNKTLGIIYSFLGAVLAVGGLIMLSKLFTQEREPAQPQLNLSFHRDSFPLEMSLIAAFFAILFLLIAYGLFRKKRWARISVLVLAFVLIWLFPLGTILGSVYISG
jgi:lysylphosphatidylglycerol synthetase-like protein (DUF2156 family)